MDFWVDIFHWPIFPNLVFHLYSLYLKFYLYFVTLYCSNKLYMHHQLIDINHWSPKRVMWLDKMGFDWGTILEVAQRHNRVAILEVAHKKLKRLPKVVFYLPWSHSLSSRSHAHAHAHAHAHTHTHTHTYTYTYTYTRQEMQKNWREKL